MTHKACILFCDNEHGTGDVMFPNIATLAGFELSEHLSAGWTAAEVRRKAKEAGWGRLGGVDYCPECMEAQRTDGGAR